MDAAYLHTPVSRLAVVRAAEPEGLDRPERNKPASTERNDERMTTAPTSNLTVAIVGGGITGMAAAYYLQQYADQHHLPLSYTLIDTSVLVGGKVQTDLVDGFGAEPFVIEAGPDSFLTQKPWARTTCPRSQPGGSLSRHQSKSPQNLRAEPRQTGPHAGRRTHDYPHPLHALCTLAAHFAAG